MGIGVLYVRVRRRPRLLSRRCGLQAAPTLTFRVEGNLAPPPPSQRGEGGKGAGGGLGILAALRSTYIDDANTSFILYPKSVILRPSSFYISFCGLKPSVPSRPRTPSPPFRRGGGVCYEKADEY